MPPHRDHDDDDDDQPRRHRSCTCGRCVESHRRPLTAPPATPTAVSRGDLAHVLILHDTSSVLPSPQVRSSSSSSSESSGSEPTPTLARNIVGENTTCARRGSMVTSVCRGAAAAFHHEDREYVLDLLEEALKIADELDVLYNTSLLTNEESGSAGCTP